MVRHCYSGLVTSFSKGSSRCLFTYTILLAIRVLARSLNSRVVILKIRRCSDKMSTIADMLSKCQLEDAKDLMVDSVFGKYSSTFVSWLANPSTTRGLGIAIVKELSARLRLPNFETEWEEEYVNLVKTNNF